MATPRVAIVTGSNKGIGLSIVRALCKQFDGVVYLTARNEERGKKAVKDLEAEGLKPKFHLLDITDQQSILTLKDDIVKEYGGVDVFVHNAATAYKAKDTAPFSEQAVVTIATNFTASVNLSHAFLPVMKANGRFVILSSFVVQHFLPKCSKEVQAFFKSEDLTEEQLVSKMEEFVAAAQNEQQGAEEKGFAPSTYAMSKIGITALTRILGKRMRAMGKPSVLVSCADPGWVKTDMSSGKGNKTPDQGAETPVYAALLPEGSEENGEFFQDKKVCKWYQ